MVDQFVAPGSLVWWALVCLAAFGRLMDLGSTWIATPNLDALARQLASALEEAKIAAAALATKRLRSRVTPP